MMAVDWGALAFGAGFGLLAAGLFFAGLAWGMRLALARARPAPVLLISATLRIAALLALGVWIAGQGVSALAGFALAFVAVRFAVLTFARPAAPNKAAPWT